MKKKSTKAARVAKLWTTGTMARELGLPFFKVANLVRGREDIRPCGKRGQANLYNADAFNQVRKSLELEEDRRKVVEWVTRLELEDAVAKIADLQMTIASMGVRLTSVEAALARLESHLGMQVHPQLECIENRVRAIESR